MKKEIRKLKKEYLNAEKKLKETLDKLGKCVNEECECPVEVFMGYENVDVIIFNSRRLIVVCRCCVCGGFIPYS